MTRLLEELLELISQIREEHLSMQYEIDVLTYENSEILKLRKMLDFYIKESEK